MDYRKSAAPVTTVTRNLDLMTQGTGNIYETVIVVSRRANQISVEMKQELNKKLEEFASYSDNLEEVFENREQIEIRNLRKASKTNPHCIAGTRGKEDLL